jgi:hypothetical protein
MNKPLILGVVTALAMAGGQANAVNAANDGPASAGVIYSNLGPGDTYGGGSLFAIDRTSTFFVEWAAGFVPSSNFTLTQIDVGILHGAGTSAVMLSLEGASSAGHPGWDTA